MDNKVMVIFLGVYSLMSVISIYMLSLKIKYYKKRMFIFRSKISELVSENNIISSRLKKYDDREERIVYNLKDQSE